jgi:hypothetical protein
VVPVREFALDPAALFAIGNLDFDSATTHRPAELMNPLHSERGELRPVRMRPGFRLDQLKNLVQNGTEDNGAERVQPFALKPELPWRTPTLDILR